ncbi:MAG TPA: AAA family ATPase [Woeseiaceae bacterium]|nr:AAA family ATPase [Woeseiaceae bacterium]
MYTQFFGLNEKPFAITPDPRYLFMSERHGEGLAHLVYGVTESGGFIQLTGEVGTGKTTLVRTLLGQMPAEVDVALILNPNLTALEFLVAICEELRIPLPEDRKSAKAHVDALNRHLLDTHSRGRRTILLVDEAQNLSAEVLEQLRLLTNLETSRQKLLQIILIAQPELRDMLSQPNLRQLAQRVTGRYHLEPLSRDEAVRYIDHRLKVAGALAEIFEPAAKREVYRLSGGIPRLMNVICDRSLLGAYSRETRTIDKRTVRRAAAEVSGTKLIPVLLRWAWPAGGVLTALLIVAGAWSLLREEPLRSAGAGHSSAGTAAAAVLEAVPLETVPAPAADAGPVVPPEGGPSLDEILQTGRGSDPASALETLLGLWGAEYREGAGTACSQAEALGLRCYFSSGSFTGIRQLDRPAVLTLTDSTGANHQAVLVALSDDTGTLAIGERRTTWPLGEISRLWFGEYLLLWRPPEGVEALIRPGTTHPNVPWLRQSLATIDPGYRPANLESRYFDAELEQQVMEFQRSRRLRVDGIAGTRTQILISSSLGRDGTPRLTAPAAAEQP